MYRANLKSDPSNRQNSGSPYQMDPIYDYGVQYHSMDDTFSDFIYYLTKNSPISMIFTNLISIIISFQWVILSLNPYLHLYWGVEPSVKHILDLLGYISLTKSPPFTHTSYLPLLITIFAVFVSSEMLLNGVNLYYMRKNYINKTLCGVLFYICMTLYTILFPFICSISSVYINVALNSNIEETANDSLSVLVLILLFYSFGRMITLTIFVNYNMSFESVVFQSWRSSSMSRLLLSLGLMSCLSPILSTTTSRFPSLHIVILIISFFNLVIELYEIHWVLDWQFYIMGSSLLTSCIVCVFIIADAINSTINLQYYIFVFAPVVFLIGLHVLYYYNHIIIKKTLAALSNKNYVKTVRSPARVIRDFKIGLQHNHPNVIKSKFVKDIVNKFPNSLEIYLFFGRFSLVISTCPISINEIGAFFHPKTSFSPIISHVFISMKRLMAPTSYEELETYDKHVVNIKKTLYFLLGSGKQLYDFILDELTGNIPNATLTFERLYNVTFYRMFKFVQRYPGSYDGEYFINLLSNIFPDSKELKELKYLHNYNPDYANLISSYMPALINARLKNPNAFIPYRPEYQKKCNTNVQPLYPSYQTPEEPEMEEEMDNIENNDEQNEIEKHEKRLFKSKGPYENVLKKWYIYALLFISFLLPIILNPFFFHQNTVFRTRGNHLVFSWYLLARLERFITFLYGSVFFTHSDDSWNQFIGEVNTSAEDWRLFIIDYLDNLQHSILHTTSDFEINLAIGNDIRSTLMNLLSSTINFPLIPGDDVTIAQGMMFMTFIGMEILTVDSVFIKKKGDIPYTINILREMHNYLHNIYYPYVEILRTINFESDPPINIPMYAALIIEFVAMTITAIVLIIITRTAISRSNLFFTTLRETSKSAITHVRQYFIKQQNDIGMISRQKHKSYRAYSFTFILEYVLPIILMTLMILCCIILDYFLYACYNKQIQREIDLYEVYTYVSQNVSYAEQLHEEILFEDYLSPIGININNNVQQIDDLIGSVGSVQTIWGDRGNLFCPLCTRRELYMTKTSDGPTHETKVFDWLASISFAIHSSLSPSFLTPIHFNVSNNFFFEYIYTLDNFATELESQCNALLYTTVKWQYIVYGIMILIMIIFHIFIFFIIQRADAPFTEMVKLLKLLPEKALSKDTLRILTENFWDFTVDHFEFDPSYYDKVLEKLPDGVIIIDQNRTIITYNHQAENIIDAKIISKGENLFKENLFLIDFTVMDSNDGPQNQSLKEIINNYLFDDRITLPNYKLKGFQGAPGNQKSCWYSLTILPIFDEVPDQSIYQSRGADNFALIFQDIGHEVSKQSLLDQENKKYMDIIYQILPQQIADRLLQPNNGMRSFSFLVPKVAISFCDIVSFTPWCAQQKPEVVVNCLNQMFKVFDALCSKYCHVTKIKCIGDCYMSAAGVFSEGIDPSIPGRQMVNFDLDSIAGISTVNEENNTSLRVRIGIAYGGPVVAGVMGIQKPVFDIWGETVNEAQHMESSGEPMHVHIQEELYNIVCDEPLVFKPRNDGTWLVRRY